MGPLPLSVATICGAISPVQSHFAHPKLSLSLPSICCVFYLVSSEFCIPTDMFLLTAYHGLNLHVKSFTEMCSVEG